MSTFIIAEAGSCHDGDLYRAAELIDVAKAAGANACKFQYWSSAIYLAERRNAHDYFETYFKYKVPEWWLAVLKKLCDDVGIEFMTTCYLPEDIPIIAPYVKRFKVASFEAQDADFIDAHAKYGKEIIVSTGMFNRSYYSGVLVGSGPGRGIHTLHCISAYPTPIEQANLGAIRYCHGYSDHTHDVLTGALAVAAGAQILEVHFRLDDTDPANPDYATALTPGQLKDYI